MASIRHTLLVFSLLAWELYGIEAKLMHTHPIVRDSTATTEHIVHVVYLGGISNGTTTNNEDLHKGILQQALGSVHAASSSHLYSYTKSFNGFAAAFSPYHAEMIRGMDGVVSVFQSQIMQVHTTDSWEYLGLNPTQGVWLQSDFGNGTIVGMIDTGIWPESESFKDDGFGPIPSKWKGSCVSGDNFTAALCNQKLIGAKFYDKGYAAQIGPVIGQQSPRDYEGHGTHTSSTSTGRRVPNASLDGVANGTASGGVPSARIAMYKVCWPAGCTDVDLLAAMDDAIADGVDVMSISIGFSSGRDYKTDSIAIGAFHAVVNDVFVSCSAGNSGQFGYSTVVNAAPWIFTIAATTQNRVLDPVLTIASAEGQLQVKRGINTLNTMATNESYPIIYVTDIYGLTTSEASGKIIAMEVSSFSYDYYVQSVNGTGLVGITGTDQSVQISIPVVPFTNMDEQTGSEIVNFINTTTNTTAFISKAQSVYNSTQTPVVAWFSSIGPNVITPQILKPDISAPGVDILAAWAPFASTDRVTDFNIISGTSMACPHAAGTAALVKSLHPDWSPAAIKSAIMTTATAIGPLNRFESFGNDSIAGNSQIATGVGQINPAKAADPGLVFNITTADYVNFLCGIGYNASSVQLMTGDNETCTNSHFTALELNYPSIYLSSNFTVGVVQNITRKVTNVGPGPVTYSLASLLLPPELDVGIDPITLQFANTNEEQSFNVSVTVIQPISDYSFASFVWTDNAGHDVTVTVGVGLPPNAPF